jgi:hypothetical protein
VPPLGPPAHPVGRPWPNPGVPWPRAGWGGPPIGPARPVYREPHPIRTGAVWAGIGSTVVWFGMFAAVSVSARAYAWLTVVAALLALLAATALARFGDRGVAVGVAGTAGLGLGIAGIIVVAKALAGTWLLW